MDIENREPAALRKRLWQLLGDIPLAGICHRSSSSRGAKSLHITLEHFCFDNGIGDRVYGYLLLPVGIDEPSPAVLYHHEHGGKYSLGKDAILRIRENGYAPGIALVEAGYVVMAIDAYAFCERQAAGSGRQR